jgi:hypothetical protein
MLTLMIWLTVAAVPPGFLKPLGRMRMVKGVPGICIALEGRVGMTRAIVDQKLSALLSAEVRLERTSLSEPLESPPGEAKAVSSPQALSRLLSRAGESVPTSPLDRNWPPFTLSLTFC